LIFFFITPLIDVTLSPSSLSSLSLLNNVAISVSLSLAISSISNFAHSHTRQTTYVSIWKNVTSNDQLDDDLGKSG
jgi:hypothetical protein